jgi:D-beta-D-heptose 7-phosphate kinase/D-beta-D-heptose 1-phosphate adenosyltransferase
MTTLLHRLRAFQPFTAMVVGDFMLDQHVYGAAERLSPDAPVPVLHATKFDDRPGGASNVSLCLRGLKGEVVCFGAIGEDHEGRVLRTKLIEAGCDVEGLIVDPSRPTTIKRSLIGLAQHRHPQKMFRMDIETREPLPPEMTSRLRRMIEARIGDADVMCVEDYNKGVCTPEFCQWLIKLCRARRTPIMFDPAAIEDYSKYRGATAITPNRSEAELATGLDTPLEASELHNAGLATKLLNELELDAVVLTLDKHGALLEERGGEPVIVPTIAREVYDVTGAGDMVLAALAGARVNGLSWLDAVQFANVAAGLEVQVFGAQPIPFAQVQREVMMQTCGLDGKIRSADELIIELAVHREAGKRVVLTNGCFDVIHAGHVAYLREAKSLGDLLVVGVNCDEQVRLQKGAGRPVYREAERLEILSELQCIDYLIVFEEPTAHDLINAVRPDVYVKGGDYRPQDINEYDLVRQLGIDLHVLAHRPGLGSRTVIERLRAVEGFTISD